MATHAAQKLRSVWGDASHKSDSWDYFQKAFGSHFFLLLRIWLDESRLIRHQRDKEDGSYMFCEWCLWFLQTSDFAAKAQRFKTHAKALSGRRESNFARAMLDSFGTCDSCADLLEVRAFNDQQEMVLMVVDATRMEMSITTIKTPEKSRAAKMLSKLDTNGDGSICAKEFIAAGGTQSDFDRFDRDGTGFLDRDELVEPEVVVRVKIANFVSLRPLGNQLVIQTSVGDDINVTFNSTNLRRLVGDCLSELQGYASVGEYALF